MTVTAPFLPLPFLVDCCVCTPVVITVVVSVFNVITATAAIVVILVPAAVAVAIAAATFAIVGAIIAAVCHWLGCCCGHCAMTVMAVAVFAIALCLSLSSLSSLWDNHHCCHCLGNDDNVVITRSTSLLRSIPADSRGGGNDNGGCRGMGLFCKSGKNTFRNIGRVGSST